MKKYFFKLNGNRAVNKQNKKRYTIKMYQHTNMNLYKRSST